MPPKSSKDDARSQIDKMLDSKIDEELLNQLFENVLAITKKARGWCPSCKKQVWVDIPDARAVMSALNELLIQAKGRPAQSEGDEKQAFSFVNKVVLVRDDV